MSSKALLTDAAFVGSFSCVETLVVYQDGSLGKFLSTVSTLFFLHSQAGFPVCFEVGGVPEVFSTDVTFEFSLRLMAQHVLVKAPPSPSLKLLPTNLTGEKGGEVLHLLVNFVI